MTTTSIPVHGAFKSERLNRTEARDKSSTGPAPQAAGMLWFGGWLFTIGFANLVWWKAILGLVVWPYFLGTTFR